MRRVPSKPNEKPRLIFMAASTASATTLGLIALPALVAGAVAPPAEPDALQDDASNALVEWASGDGATLSDPACTLPSAPEPGEPITCYATDGTGNTLAFLTVVPADGVRVFEVRPEATGVQPPEGYPADTGLGDSAPAGEFTQAEGNAQLTAPTPEIGPASNFASPVPIGEPADVGGGWTLTVNGVAPDATDR